VELPRRFTIILCRKLIFWSSEPDQLHCVAADEHQHDRGAIMTRPQIQAGASVPAFVPSPPRNLYSVVQQENVWFIKFNGADYGPYQSEREAMLFAVDAAQKLGEQGQETQVVLLDENGEVQTTWTYGQDSFPPR
jgi:hypothetical protein